MLKVKAGYYFELLTSETTKLLGSIKSKITKDKNCEKVPNLEITEVVLVYCNNVKKQLSTRLKIQESCIRLFLINCLVNY